MFWNLLVRVRYGSLIGFLSFSPVKNQGASFSPPRCLPLSLHLCGRFRSGSPRGRFELIDKPRFRPVSTFSPSNGERRGSERLVLPTAGEVNHGRACSPVPRFRTAGATRSRAFFLSAGKRFLERELVGLWLTVCACLPPRGTPCAGSLLGRAGWATVKRLRKVSRCTWYDHEPNNGSKSRRTALYPSL